MAASRCSAVHASRADEGLPEKQQIEATSSADTDVFVQKYNDIVVRAELATVQLCSLSFNVKDTFFSERNKKRPRISYSIKSSEYIFDDNQDYAAVKIDCIVTAKGSRSSNILVCKAVYLVAYKNLSGCDENVVKAFLGRVGRFAGYPYFRSLFASLDWNAGTRMPPLPILKQFAPKLPVNQEGDSTPLG